MKKKAPIRILYFITSLDIGGAEQLLLLTLKKINRQKYEPAVCCLYGGELVKEIERLDIKVMDLKVKNWFDLSYIIKIYKLLTKEKFDILHTHLFHANIIGRIMGRLCKVPVVVSTQHYTFKYKGNFRNYLDKITVGLTDRIIAVSEAVKCFCINEVHIAENKLALIYNGIDTDMQNRQFDCQPRLRENLFLNDDFIIGCIGSFREVKGHEYLLRAIADLVRPYDKIKLLLIGSGPLEVDLKRMADKLGISEKVLFLKKRRDVPHILSSIDLYIMPSLQEGLSMVLLEAMAMGKPCIVTDVGGNPEAIVNEESGILVPARDHKAIAGAITVLLEDKKKLKEFGSKARIRAIEKFGIKESVCKTEELYEELIQQKLKI